MSSKSVIIKVESRVEQLITDHKRLFSLCQSLKSERDSLLIERRDLQEQLKELRGQLSVSQLREGFETNPLHGEESRERARARVNQLMREVDRCIGLLSATE